MNDNHKACAVVNHRIRGLPLTKNRFARAGLPGRRTPTNDRDSSLYTSLRSLHLEVSSADRSPLWKRTTPTLQYQQRCGVQYKPPVPQKRRAVRVTACLWAKWMRATAGSVSSFLFLLTRCYCATWPDSSEALWACCCWGGAKAVTLSHQCGTPKHGMDMARERELYNMCLLLLFT